MSDSSVAPVIAGLAVGIAFIVIMSTSPTLFAPTYIPHLGAGLQEAISATKNIPEVRAFAERHPDTMIQYCAASEYCNQTQILYSKTQYGHGQNFATLTVAVDLEPGFVPSNVHVYCDVENEVGNSMSSFPAHREDYLEFIRNGSCLK
jgi:hypothetical protein